MKRQHADRQMVRYPRIWQWTAAAYRSARYKPMIQGLVEVDVTTARCPAGAPGEDRGIPSAPGERVISDASLRQVRSGLCSWAQMQCHWTRWTRNAPPPQLATLLAEIAQSRPIEPTTCPPALSTGSPDCALGIDASRTLQCED